MPTNASPEKLVDYKHLNISEENKHDQECCWGVAYKISLDKWAGGLQEKIKNKYPLGFKETTTTFYPTVDITYLLERICFNHLKLKTRNKT